MEVSRDHDEGRTEGVEYVEVKTVESGPRTIPSPKVLRTEGNLGLTDILLRHGYVATKTSGLHRLSQYRRSSTL